MATRRMAAPFHPHMSNRQSCPVRPCGVWRCMQQLAADYGLPSNYEPIHWLELRDFNCTGCNMVPRHILSFFPEPLNRQPAVLHGPAGRRIELHCTLCLETLDACDWCWPMFAQAVRQPVVLDEDSIYSLSWVMQDLCHQPYY